MTRYSWPFVYVETLFALLVLTPVFNLLHYLPNHNFSTDGWTFWPLGEWFEGRFDPFEIGDFLTIAWLIAAIRRYQRKELFDK